MPGSDLTLGDTVATLPPNSRLMGLDLGSKTNISYHLAKLREAGVTRTEAVGTSRLISLRRADLELRFPGLLDSILASARILSREPADQLL